MSLDKAIDAGKEHRKQYRGAKFIDMTCRNHGSCEWCKNDRLYNRRRKEASEEQELNEYKS